MSTSTFQPELPLTFPLSPDRVPINGSLYFSDRDGHRVIFKGPLPLYRICLADQVHLREVAVNLRLSEQATQKEIAQAFGHSVITQSRWEHAFQKRGVEGLIPGKPSGRPRALGKSQEDLIRNWFHRGFSNVEMAKRLSVDEVTVRRTLKRLNLARATRLSPPLPGIEDPASPVLAAVEAGEQAVQDMETVVAEACDVEKAQIEANTSKRVGGQREPEPSDVQEETAQQVGVMTEGNIASPAAEDRPETAEGTASAAAMATPFSAEPALLETLRVEPSAKEVLAFSIDFDPRDRSGDRMLARLGQLEDARPMFAEHQSLPRAGVLLAVPLLVGHGMLGAFAKVYGASLGPSFYGLRTIAVTLFLAALLRIKRPEQLKEHHPGQLGAVIGLDRSPETKTVRRKFTILAEEGRGKALMDELARVRVAEDKDRLAFAYIDGHVQEYHGKFPLFPAKKPQRQVVTPAATDFWVHDAYGEPLLVVTCEINAQLTQVLEEIVADMRRIVGDQRRITIIFDRGGYSPKLFARLIATGFDIITYRKGKVAPLPKTRFTVQREEIDGAEREYVICDRPRVRVGVLSAKKKKGKKGKRSKRRARKQYLWMREIRVLRDDGRQTVILTNRRDLSAVEVAYRMFFRWRQENYFKYMDAEFALDGLIEYGTNELTENTDRPNPEWTRRTRQLREARKDVDRLRSELGRAAASNEEASRPTMRGFKIAHTELRKQLQEAETRVERLLKQRAKIDKRIPAKDRVALKTEKKLIANAIKMAAYQVETELLTLLHDHYPRSVDEGRTLLQAAFQSSARIEVTEQELRVTIAPQSSPHRTAALSSLCKQLDALATCFPGTNLRLRLAIQAGEPIVSE